MGEQNSVKLDLSILCPQCKHDYFLLNKKEINETTTETLFMGTHTYTDTQYYLTCCNCGNTFRVVDE